MNKLDKPKDSQLGLSARNDAVACKAARISATPPVLSTGTSLEVYLSWLKNATMWKFERHSEPFEFQRRAARTWSS